MNRILAASLGLSLAIAPAAFAQHSAKPATRNAATVAPATADPAAAFLGEWEGTIQTPHGTDAVMRLTIARDSTNALAVAVEYLNMGDMKPSKGYGLQLEKNGLRWTHIVGANECKNSAALANGQLDGETACGQMSVAFSLKKS